MRYSEVDTPGLTPLRLEKLDPYSSYMNADEWAVYLSSFSGEYAGVGVNVSIDSASGFPQVRYLMIGSTAGTAGVRRGDRIVKVDGRNVHGLSFDEVLPMMRGVPGTFVELTVRHAGSTEEVPLRIERKTIKSPSVRGVRRDSAGTSHYLLDEQHGIGYIRVLGLADDTMAELTRALTLLKRQRMKGLVLDLRDSTGGKMKVAVAAADLFLDSGRILSIASRGTEEVFDATAGVETEVPMVMLISDRTVSSSEMLAGALTDNKRAITMGQRTFGKGRVQRYFALCPPEIKEIGTPCNKGGIVVSTGTFQRPSGKTIDKHDASASKDNAGIAPDPGMEIALEEKELEAWRTEMDRLDGPFLLTTGEQTAAPDRVLERALEVLSGAMAHARKEEAAKPD